MLIGARARTPFPYLGRVFRFARKMGIWAMLEVLLLGVFVAYTKLGDLVHIEVGPAVLALGLLTIITLWADTVLDPDAVWEAIERRGQTHAPHARGPLAGLPSRHGGCEACGLVAAHDGAHRERAHALPALRLGAACAQARRLNRTWAFVIAAAILYIPANAYPVLTVIQAGVGRSPAPSWAASRS